MKINVNEKKQAQCPGCGSWRELLPDHMGSENHEFKCCNRSFIIYIDKKGLEKLSKKSSKK